MTMQPVGAGISPAGARPRALPGAVEARSTADAFDASGLLSSQHRTIDAIDRAILDLLATRAEAVAEVARAKSAFGAPAVDLQRERQVLDAVARENTGLLDDGGVRRIFAAMLVEMRSIVARRMARRRDTPPAEERGPAPRALGARVVHEDPTP